MKSPLVSVVMSVYNGEKFLAASIESILGQTFRNLEFIIINDGSTDNGQKIINSYLKNDKRIKSVIRKNKGLIYSLNEGLNLAKGEYIARQDADDISLPGRLETQVAVLEKEKSIGMVGSNYEWIDSAGNVINATNVFTNSSDLKAGLVFCNQFGHGTVMFRKSIILELGGYSENHKYAEDYDLWTRLARKSSVVNLKEIAYQWRHHETSVSQRKANDMAQSFYFIRDREFEFYTKNKRGYHINSLHPFTVKDGVASYFIKKARMLRDLSLLYSYKHKYVQAAGAALLSVIYQPTSFRSYKQLYLCMFDRSSLKGLEYEYL